MALASRMVRSRLILVQPGTLRTFMIRFYNRLDGSHHPRIKQQSILGLRWQAPLRGHQSNLRWQAPLRGHQSEK